MICAYCSEKINGKCRGVLLKTFHGKKIVEEIYFHLDCYKKWHDDKAAEKSKKQMEKLIQNSMKIALGKLNS